MSQSKTDKIRERLEGLKGRNLTAGDEEYLFEALEAVVKELPLQCRCGDHGKGVTCNACKNINLIADELNVEE